MTYFKRKKEGKGVKYVPIESKIADKESLFGKFALFTDDFTLKASSIARIYKTCIVVGHEFHLLKSVLCLRTFNHWKPNRIEVHVAIALWGVMALALLRLILINHGMTLSFERLIELIKNGSLSIGDYIYPQRKSFRIKRTLNIHPQLEEILSVLKLDWDYFEITVIPTENEKN